MSGTAEVEVWKRDAGADGVPAEWRIPVPDDYLRIPWANDLKKIWRFESGLVLDPHLRKLSRVSGAVDRSLALRMRRMRERRGYIPLGYSRFPDWVRERTGLSVRTAQELVRLGKGLERLPLLDRALRDGRVTWTGAAQVARVAGVEDEREWVAKAESLSVRELTRMVSEAVCERSGVGRGVEPSDNSNKDTRHAAEDRGEGAGGDRSEGENRPEAAVVDDEEERVERLAVDSVDGTAMLWEAAVDLCGMVAGAELGCYEAPEYILAELISALPAPPDGDNEISPRNPPLKYRVPPRKDGRRCAAALLAEELGPRLLPPALSADCEALLASLDDAVPDDLFDLDRSVRELISRRGALDLDLARMLRIFRMLGLHRHIGFTSFGAYVAERLGISPSRASFLARLDRRLLDFPEIKRALRDGRIGCVAALELTRVAVRGVSEKAWVARATRRTVVRLREEVTWAERRSRLFGCRETPLPPPPGKLPDMLDEVTEQLGSEGDWLRAERGACTRSADEQTFAHPDGQDALRNALLTIGKRDSGPLVTTEFSLRESAVELWTDARRRLAAATGDTRILDRDVLLHAAVEFLVTYLPLWFDELAHGNPIAVRERFRCAIPGCTVRGGSPHHLQYQSQGGSDDEDNLLYVCYTHHIEGQHRGRLRVHGRAPDDLVFELGIRPDGTPLEIFVNEERRPEPVFVASEAS
jgi:hypothetical protein